MRCYPFYIVFFLMLFQQLNAQSIVNLEEFFAQSDLFFQEHVDENGLLNYKALTKDRKGLDALINFLAEPIHELTAKEQKAVYINAYNLFVIDNIVKHYPIKSTQEVNGFFEQPKFKLLGKKLSLNELEELGLVTAFRDARLHFVLNCGAIGCPPLARFSYKPTILDAQLNLQTQKALNDSGFIKVDDFSEMIYHSKIFEWYEADFGGNIRAFIDSFRSEPLPAHYKLKSFAYNWQLNTSSDDYLNQQKRGFVPIVASSTLPKGYIEFKTFNGFFSAKYPNASFGGPLRSTFFSSFNQLSYGLTGRLDLGVDVVLRATLLGDFAQKSAFRVFSLPNGICVHADEDGLGNGDSISIYKASGLSHLAPRIRWAPFKKLPNFSFQQAIYFPIQKPVDGNYLWVSQFYYAHNFGTKMQLFLDFTIWQPFQPQQKMKLAMPFFKAFYSWFPNKRLTLYATTTWGMEWGAGAKFLIAPQWEIEFLATRYLPLAFIENNFGIGATTCNVGMRYRLKP